MSRLVRTRGGRYHHWRTRNHRAHRGLAGDRRSGRGSDNLRALPWQRHNPAGRNNCGGSRYRGRGRLDRGPGRYGSGCCGHWRMDRHCSGTRRGLAARICLGLLAGEDCLHRVARLGNVGEVEGQALVSTRALAAAEVPLRWPLK